MKEEIKEEEAKLNKDPVLSEDEEKVKVDNDIKLLAKKAERKSNLKEEAELTVSLGKIEVLDKADAAAEKKPLESRVEKKKEIEKKLAEVKEKIVVDK